MSNVVPSETRLSDAQLVLLSAASQRKDALVVLANTTASTARTVTSLIRRRLLTEVPVRPRQPSWREDAAGPVGLQVTKEGFAALGIEREPASLPKAEAPIGSPPPAVSVRSGTKQAAVVDLLSRDEGATLRELASAMGWLPHTTRAALTGLRRRGYRVGSSTTANGERSYWIAQAAA